ncbi:flavin reductase [Streptomyces sp. ISL-66]|uniref:flavin reductase family protein n=1 Tax=Streptomyces sp. ISL-66 TaxID=2819186 RepID=UPI001BE89EBE|nr:flavin reductase family protein [Streptomyces sp. ISL-66]MBT2470037.1 flavin reductase [Streptomyces sp. ISL-66]
MTDLGDFAAVLDGPMYVVTVEAEGERAGCLVGFASQCSIHPPRFVVWLSVANHTYRVAREASYLTVHALSRGQRELAEIFGGETGDRVDKFARADWRPGGLGGPVLTEVRTWFTGRIEGRLEGGDHMGFLLAPIEGSGPAEGAAAPETLRYGDVRDLEPGHPA